MKTLRIASLGTIIVFLLCLIGASAQGADDPLAKWRPSFDPSGAKYVYLLSCSLDQPVH